MARPLQGQRAGIVSRFVADAIDFVVVIAALIGVYLGFSAFRFLLEPRRFTWPEPSAMYLGSLGWIILILYLTIAWANTGRTFGKRVLGLRVVTAANQRLPLWLAFVRAFLCALVPIGLFWSVVSSTSASVQDLIVRTHVVYDWRPKLPPLEP